MGIDSMIIMFPLPLGLEGVLFKMEWAGGSVSLCDMTGKRFQHYWPFVRRIHQSLVDSIHKGQIMRSFDIFLSA